MALLRENDHPKNLILCIPPISVSELDGEYLDWPRLYDLFVELKHS